MVQRCAVHTARRKNSEKGFFQAAFLCGGLCRLLFHIARVRLAGQEAFSRSASSGLLLHKALCASGSVWKTPVLERTTFYGTCPTTGNGRSRNRSWTFPFSGLFEALRGLEPLWRQLPPQSQWYPSLHKGNPTSLLPPSPAYTFTFALRVLLSLYGRNSM